MYDMIREMTHVCHYKRHDSHTPMSQAMTRVQTSASWMELPPAPQKASRTTSPVVYILGMCQISS